MLSGEQLQKHRDRYARALDAHHKSPTTATLAGLQGAEDAYVQALSDWADSCGLVVRLPHQLVTA